MTKHNVPDNSRRLFWKRGAQLWVKEVKKAQYKDDFSESFQGVKYRHLSSGSAEVSFLATRDFPQIVAKNSIIYTFEAPIEKKSVFLDFITAKRVTACLTVGSPLPKSPVPNIIYSPVLSNLPPENLSKSPSLLLFENHEVADIIHSLPKVLAKLPQGSDVYIGNIASDLKATEKTPTKDRIFLFLKETASAQE